MSIPQTNFENNNRMSELTKNINDIFGYILLYSVIIFTALSALLGGIVVYPIYGLIYIFNKIRTECCKSAAQNEIVANEIPAETKPEKKPIIDENWCNVSVKNIINYSNEVTNEVEEADVNLEEDEVEEADANLEVADANLENETESVVQNEIQSEAEVAVVNLEAVVNLAEVAVVNLEEVLSIRRPSEEELKEFQKEQEEADDASDSEDYSPKDKYSIGHYKSKTRINDPLDFDN